MREKLIILFSVIFISGAVGCAAYNVTHPSGQLRSESEQNPVKGVFAVRDRMYDERGNTVFVNPENADDYEKIGYTKTPPESESLTELKNQIFEYTATRNGDWGVYVKKLQSNEYLSVNEKEYSSASLIKLFTMAAVYNELEAGTFEMNDDISHSLELMICESDNTACNHLTSVLGGGNTVHGFDIENANTAALGCQNTNHGSELVDGSGHVTFTGYNMTSPRDCGIVLEKIYRGKLVSSTASASMLDLLLNQTRNWKIPESLPEGTVTANKTGETDTTEADAALVYSPACNYVICVIGNGNVGNGVYTIQDISKMVYDYFNN